MLILEQTAPARTRFVERLIIQHMNIASNQVGSIAMKASVSVLALLFTASCLFGSTQTARPYVFGLNIGMSDAECKLAKEAGCTNTRIGCGWDLIEKEPGKYDWRDPDHDVAQCLKWGFEPFFLIVATPKWALPPDKQDKVWGRAPLPEYYPAAAKFYRMLTERYKGKVKYYEYWNEENGYGWHEPNRPEEYAPILKIAYKALKEGNPDCQVAIGGLDGAGWKGYYHYLERLYELGCGDYFDAVAVHPYRADGPIDIYGLKKIHEVLVKHGQGHKKIWITEYGWDKEYGHHNKARWLKQSLDMLTSPELDFVFQASVHTLGNFDDSEYGLCDRQLNPRPAYKVFKEYPKDWSKINALHKTPPPQNHARPTHDDFDDGKMRWTPYGDGLVLTRAGTLGIREESPGYVLAVRAEGQPKNGGAWYSFAVKKGLPVRVEARIYTNQHGNRADNSRCRIGIDPTGGTDPKAPTIVWGRSKDTSGERDTSGVGQGDIIIAKSDKVTVFLDYTQKGTSPSWEVAFDLVRFFSQEETFKLPQ